MSDYFHNSLNKAHSHSNPALETNCHVHPCENRETVVFLYNGILLRNKREATNETWNNMNTFQNHYVETKKLDTKENLLLYDSNNMKFRTGKIISDDRSQNRGGMGWGG